MSRIRGRDTGPEMSIRRGLHALGLRYRLHDRHLPGTPDLVFPGPRVIIFVHGCFWHGHDCSLGVRPQSNAAFWSEKITRNQARDREAIQKLGNMGWRLAVVWECALKGSGRRPLREVLGDLCTFIRYDSGYKQLDICALTNVENSTSTPQGETNTRHVSPRESGRKRPGPK
ncbi:very short patch repair endonuclease [Sinorhizobium meliloti]|uniref:very short patch repair endonuclease n=1 Tax=Rhizobium meliloti TaxID=382 RepID=UPI003D64F789